MVTLKISLHLYFIDCIHCILPYIIHQQRYSLLCIMMSLFFILSYLHTSIHLMINLHLILDLSQLVLHKVLLVLSKRDLLYLLLYLFFLLVLKSLFLYTIYSHHLLLVIGLGIHMSTLLLHLNHRLIVSLILFINIIPFIMSLIIMSHLTNLILLCLTFLSLIPHLKLCLESLGHGHQSCPIILVS